MQDSNNQSPPDDREVVKRAAATSSQSVNKRSDKSLPPKVDTQSDKVAKGTSTTNSQSGNTQPDNNISQPDDEMQRYATKGDLKVLSTKMDEKFATKADLKVLKKGIIKSVKKMNKKFATKEDLVLFQLDLKAYIAIQIKDSIKFLTNVIFYVFGFGVGVAGLIIAFIAFFFGTK